MISHEARLPGNCAAHMAREVHQVRFKHRMASSDVTLMNSHKAGPAIIVRCTCNVSGAGARARRRLNSWRCWLRKVRRPARRAGDDCALAANDRQHKL